MKGTKKHANIMISDISLEYKFCYSTVLIRELCVSMTCQSIEAIDDAVHEIIDDKLNVTLNVTQN